MEFKNITLAAEDYVHLMVCFEYGREYYKQALENARKNNQPVSFWENRVERCERVFLEISK